MGGSLDGSKEMMKMDPSVMWVVIGKQGNGGNGMDVQIYLENLMKNLLIHLNNPDSSFLVSASSLKPPYTNGGSLY